jgi:2',3'-cyclic-nucleotide 2'-phosphodiesterase/3'-nucleotidase
LSVRDRRVVRHDVELLKVWSDELPPHPAVAGRVTHYRAAVAGQIGPPIGRAAQRITRKYHRESALGSLCADAMRDRARADVAFTNAGGLRADLPQGDLDRGHVLDAFPFRNDLVTLALDGRAIKAVLEQGCSLEAGMVQVSGLRARYDLARPAHARLVDVEVNGAPVRDEQAYRVATNSFLAEGGDGYVGFNRGRVLERGSVLSDVIVEHVRAAKVVAAPPPGRLVSVSAKGSVA